MADNYRALTRTYRPASFDDIVSQKHVSNTLKNAIKQQRLAHAYMFCGPRGVGKTTMARVLAREVNDIDHQVDGESLNKTLNVIEIDAASNNSVNDIRDLRERVRIPPQNGRYKIYIIDEVHMLSASAFNALLKTLEEPPDHIIFIFATTEPQKVLPTILSRVQRFDFKRIGISEIVSRLKDVAKKEGVQIDEESLHVIAKKADGALRDALGLMDQAIAFCGDDIQHEELLRALNVVSTDRMFDFMDTVKQHDAGRGLELIHELLQEGYDIQEYLVGLTEHIRNLYVAKSSEKMHLLEASPETKKRYKSASEHFSEDDLMRMLHIVSEAQFKIKKAQQPKIQFEITLLKLIHMKRSQKLNALLEELEQLKKKINGQPINATDSAVEDGAGDAEEKGSPNPEPKQEPQKGETEVADAQQDVPEDETEENLAPGSEASFENSDGDEPEQKPSKEFKVTESQTETATLEAEHEQDTEEAEDPLFGASSLKSSQQSNGSAGVDDVVEKKKKIEKRKPGSIQLQEVKDYWDDYLKDLRQQVPQMLYFQMQRLEPIGLKNGELVLRCNDDFAKKIIDENKRRLAKILEDGLGAFLGFRCRVQKDESNPEDSMSPYERFKKLQERDPTIKKLVELFGAELDYNLNK